MYVYIYNADYRVLTCLKVDQIWDIYFWNPDVPMKH